MDSNYHIHSFNDMVVPATCKECGYTLHKCECGYEHKDNYTPVGEHSFKLIEETAPTCTEPGRKKYRCTVCGEVKEEVFSSGHSWGEWSIKQHPTCTEKGVQMRICSRCGDVEESEIETTGHELTAPKKSETQKGYTEYFCKNCGQTVAVPSSSQKAKNFFASHKKAVIAVSVSLVMAVVLYFASVNFFVPFYHYSRAESLIEQGEDTEAFFHLKKCGSFKDSKEKLKNFKFICDKRISTRYDKDGNAVSKGEYISEYDRKGNMIRTVVYDENGNITAKYEYDEKGNQIYYVYYDGTGAVHFENKRKYEYDENGNITYWVEYDSDGNVNLESKYEYECDENGNITYYAEYDSGGNVNLESKYEYEYDKDGNVVFVIHNWYRGDESGTFKIEYEYDKNGIKTLEIGYNENGEISYKNEFNEYEQLVQQIEYNENGEFMHRIEYEYINPRYVYKP